MEALRILVWLLVLTYSTSAFAENGASPEHREWEVTGFGGGSFSNKFHFSTPVIGSGQESSRTVEMRHAAGYQIGIRTNDNVKDMWAPGLEYSFAQETLSFTNLSPTLQSISVKQFVHHFSYDVPYLVFPAAKRFRPYGGLGIGAALYYIPGSAKEIASQQGLILRDSWEFVVNCGGGFKYLVKDQFAIGVDVKDRLSGVPSYGLPVSAHVVDGRYQPGVYTHGLAQNWQVNFGLIFQWDPE